MIDWKSPAVSRVLEEALREDRATEDATSLACINAAQMATATILAKQECVLAGLGAVARIFEIFAELSYTPTNRSSLGTPVADPALQAEVRPEPGMTDGVRLCRGQHVVFIRHRARAILSCERVILNLVQRMSGIATETRRYVDAVAGTGCRILDTRKTAPGLRLLDKYAVACGGGTNHRLDLADGILVKNNHVDLAGGMRTVVERALQNRPGKLVVEVEVRSMEELEGALQYGADSILLDNMSPEQVRQAVERTRREKRKVPLEASGGITLENVRAYAEAGVDFISVGALTHSPRAVDLSMRITPA